MALLKDIHTAPPGGWRYKQAETDLLMTHRSFPELVELVAEHRRYKELPRAARDLVAIDIQRQLADAIEPRFTRPEPANTP